ncbi:MAG: 5'/3'-nucleotidase SurE [Bacteroidetes bacterium]|nr:5'/3'-nucleotidase SurE [Bacteroidota bacterium]
MEKKERPLILVTNDDSYQAKGIQSLVKAMSTIGQVVVVAPDKPQSGMGHAVTIHDPIRLHPIQMSHADIAIACSGTPVDCVKIALYTVIYSGTMSAAVEAAVEGIPAVGFSLLDYDADADFDASMKVAIEIVQQVLNDSHFPENICLNVNIPKGAEIKGIKVCRQANGMWMEQFEKRTDPFRRDYYWMTGEFVIKDKGEDTDQHALDHQYVSVVPVQFDLTAHHAVSHLQKWDIQ